MTFKIKFHTRHNHNMSEDNTLNINKNDINTLNHRFRGYYPVVIDVETAGLNTKTDALLEIAAVTLFMDKEGWLHIEQSMHFHVEPFSGANFEPEALAFNGIDPHSPLRDAKSEFEVLKKIFKWVQKGMKEQYCKRAIIVAHNAGFDHAFVMNAAKRTGLKQNPFHPFSTFDTAALSGLALGQTVLAKACLTAGLNFDMSRAHSALYDTQQTARLFCELVNRWKRLGGWPPSPLHS